MGEHPPLLTPQGPGVPRARRPGIPRVEDSGTSCSSFVIFRLMMDLPIFCRLRFWSCLSTFPSTIRYGLLHRSPCPRCPSVSLSFHPLPCVRFFSLRFPLCRDPDSFSSSYARVSPQLQTRCPLPCVRFFRFFCCCLHVQNTLQLCPRSSFESRFHHPSFGVRFCGPRVAPKRPHTTPPERQKTQGRDRLINISRNMAQFTGNEGLK